MAPPSALLPNRSHRRGGWHARVVAARDYRQMTAACVRELYGLSSDEKFPLPLDGDVVVTVNIEWGARRKRVDFDAAVSCLKPMLDGLTDAGWWGDDSQVVAMVVTQMRGEGPGMVIVSAEEGGDQRADQEVSAGQGQEGKDVPGLRQADEQV